MSLLDREINFTLIFLGGQGERWPQKYCRGDAGHPSRCQNNATEDKDGPDAAPPLRGLGDRRRRLPHQRHCEVSLRQHLQVVNRCRSRRWLHGQHQEHPAPRDCQVPKDHLGLPDAALHHQQLAGGRSPRGCGQQQRQDAPGNGLDGRGRSHLEEQTAAVPQMPLGPSHQ